MSGGNEGRGLLNIPGMLGRRRAGAVPVSQQPENVVLFQPSTHIGRTVTTTSEQGDGYKTTTTTTEIHKNVVMIGEQVVIDETTSTTVEPDMEHCMVFTTDGEHVHHDTKKKQAVEESESMKTEVITDKDDVPLDLWVCHNSKKVKAQATDANSIEEANKIQAIRRIIVSILKHPTDAITERRKLSDMPEGLALTLHRISCKMSCIDCPNKNNIKEIAKSVFEILSDYSWDAKMVMVLAALAMIYGEVRVLTELQATSNLVKSVALLKELPEDDTDLMKPGQFKDLDDLMEEMLDTTDCIFKLTKELQENSSFADVETADASIRTTVGHVISTVIACTWEIVRFKTLGVGYKRHSRLSLLRQKVYAIRIRITEIHVRVTEEITIWKKRKSEKVVEDYADLIHKFLKPRDIIGILDPHIRDDINEQPLVSPKGNRVGINKLKGKSHVLLFISDVYTYETEIAVVQGVYNKMKQETAEVVWLPIDDKDLSIEQVEKVRKSMDWYSVYEPSFISLAFIKYVRTEWNFMKRPILVVLNSSGAVLNTNALHMITIWGSAASPFTAEKEKELCHNETLGINFLFRWPSFTRWTSKPQEDTMSVLDTLIKGMEQMEQMKHKKPGYNCFYGGEDWDWIEKFTQKANQVAEAVGITLTLFYVGKSSTKSQIMKETISKINKAKVHGSTWEDARYVRFFWLRLQNMLHLKTKDQKSESNDKMTEQIRAILGFDGSHNEKGWAMICKAHEASEIAVGQDNSVIINLEKNKRELDNDPDGKAIINILIKEEEQRRKQAPSHCNHITFSESSGSIRGVQKCVYCGSRMEMYISYRCCTD